MSMSYHYSRVFAIFQDVWHTAYDIMKKIADIFFSIKTGSQRIRIDAAEEQCSEENMFPYTDYILDLYKRDPHAAIDEVCKMCGEDVKERENMFAYTDHILDLYKRDPHAAIDEVCELLEKNRANKHTEMLETERQKHKKKGNT